MKRRIIHIEESRCNGCGLCAAACHEGAIEMVNGKARLTREDYCDGLGDCLPACPTGAITFEEREAPAYDHAAVLAAKAARAADTPLPCGRSRTPFSLFLDAARPARAGPSAGRKPPPPPEISPVNCASGRFRSSSLRSTRPTLTAVIFSLLPTAPPTPTAPFTGTLSGAG